jgi:hypothetical protein
MLQVYPFLSCLSGSTEQLERSNKPLFVSVGSEVHLDVLCKEESTESQGRRQRDMELRVQVQHLFREKTPGLQVEGNKREPLGTVF